MSLPIGVDHQKRILNSAFKQLQDAQEKKKQDHGRGIIFCALSQFISELMGIANHFEYLNEEDDCRLPTAFDVTPYF